MRYPGVPYLLDTILQDATLYFIIIFTLELWLLLFLILAPVRDPLFPREDFVVLIMRACLGIDPAYTLGVSSLGL